jgi:hypothetical protein
MFHKDGDYEAFERIVAEALEHVPGMRLLGYRLMPNHWHLLLWPRGDRELSGFGHWSWQLGLESTLRPRGRPRKQEEQPSATGKENEKRFLTPFLSHLFFPDTFSFPTTVAATWRF